MINPVISEQSELAMKEQRYIQFIDDNNRRTKVYLNDEQELIQKASNAQQENTPMTDSLDVAEHNLAVATQQLSDARVSLLQAYTTGIGVLVAENDLIASREQYNAIHGI